MTGVIPRTSLLILTLSLAACATSDPPKPAAQPTPATAPRPATGTASPSQRQQWLDMFARSYFPGRSGQVFVVPKQGWFVTSRDPLYHFMHGSPWDYDVRIPILFYGAPFVKAGSFTDAGAAAGCGADRGRDHWRHAAADVYGTRAERSGVSGQ
jgi:hypothetical protein